MTSPTKIGAPAAEVAIAPSAPIRNRVGSFMNIKDLTNCPSPEGRPNGHYAANLVPIRKPPFKATLLQMCMKIICEEARGNRLECPEICKKLRQTWQFDRHAVVQPFIRENSVLRGLLGKKADVSSAASGVDT